MKDTQNQKVVSSYLSNGKSSRSNGSKRSDVGRIGKGRGVRKSGEATESRELYQRGEGEEKW